MALFTVVKTCSAPGPDKVDNSVGATTATEANSDEDQDAGDANSKEEVLTTKFPVVPSHPATALTFPNNCQVVAAEPTSAHAEVHLIILTQEVGIHPSTVLG